MSNKIVYLNGKSESDRDEESLRNMQECLSMVKTKVDSEEVDGMIIITFNQDSTSEDYLAGRLRMSEVTHVLQCLIIHNVMLTQIEEVI